MSQIINLLHDKMCIHKSKKFRLRFWNVGFRRWTIHLQLILGTKWPNLFRHLQKHLYGWRFSNDTDIHADVLLQPERQDPNFYLARNIVTPSKLQQVQTTQGELFWLECSLLAGMGNAL